MKTWHPRSWSEQARRKADGLFGYCMDQLAHGKTLNFYDTNDELHKNVTLGEYIVHSLNMSYRADIIRYRAAKRIGRKYKKYLNKK